MQRCLLSGTERDLMGKNWSIFCSSVSERGLTKIGSPTLSVPGPS